MGSRGTRRRLSRTRNNTNNIEISVFRAPGNTCLRKLIPWEALASVLEFFLFYSTTLVSHVILLLSSVTEKKMYILILKCERRNAFEVCTRATKPSP